MGGGASVGGLAITISDAGSARRRRLSSSCGERRLAWRRTSADQWRTMIVPIRSSITREQSTNRIGARIDYLIALRCRAGDREIDRLRFGYNGAGRPTTTNLRWRGRPAGRRLSLLASRAGWGWCRRAGPGLTVLNSLTGGRLDWRGQWVPDGVLIGKQIAPINRS